MSKVQQMRFSGGFICLGRITSEHPARKPRTKTAHFKMGVEGIQISGNSRLEDWVRFSGCGIIEDWEVVDEAVRQNVDRCAIGRLTP
jgi:hypothetical protein